jgi:hypothetical protein
VVDTQDATAAAPLRVTVRLLPAPGRTVTDADPAAKTTFEPFAISARNVCVPAVVAKLIVHPLEQDVLEPAAVVMLSINKAACVVADEMYAGLRNRSAASRGTTMVRVPVATPSSCGGPAVAGGCGGVPFAPAREHAERTAALRTARTSLRRFIDDDDSTYDIERTS